MLLSLIRPLCHKTFSYARKLALCHLDTSGFSFCVSKSVSFVYSF